MRRVALAALCAASAARAGVSVPPEARGNALFDQANAAYLSGETSRAVAGYEALLEEGLASPELETNLGAAYLRQGKRGLSALAARHAQGCREILQHKDKLGLPAGVSLAEGASVREGAGSCIFSPLDGSAVVVVGMYSLEVLFAAKKEPGSATVP